MKAVVLEGKGQVEVTDFPQPPMTDDSVKIRVAYCGLCGTDMHKFQGKGGSRPVKYPVPLGHEVSGVVEEVGKNVKNFKPGDRVAANPNWYCKTCHFCKIGLTHMCSNSKGVVKGFAEYICPPEENVHKIPDSLPLKEAALTEPLSCCLHGLDLLDVKIGQTVAIIGLGSIGAMMLQLLKHSAASNIIVVEPIEEKREMAIKMGATLFLNPMKDDLKAEIEKAGIENVDRVMECVGFDTTMETALDIAGKCATVVLFGLGDPEKPVHLNQYAAFQKELTIKTSFTNPNTSERAIALLSSGALDTDALISKEMSMEEVVEELKAPNYFKKGKVIVKID